MCHCIHEISLPCCCSCRSWWATNWRAAAGHFCESCTLPGSTCHMHHACPASSFHAPFDLVVVPMDAAIFAAEGCAPARCCDGYLKQHMACATCSCMWPAGHALHRQCLMCVRKHCSMCWKREVSSVLKVSSWCIIRCKRSGCWILSKYQTLCTKWSPQRLW